MILLDKLPVLAVNEVKTVVHTEIVNELKKIGYDLDESHGPIVQADIFAYKSLVENALYKCQLYNWWEEKSNYDEVTKLVFSKVLPWPLNWYIPGRYRQSMHQTLETEGYIDRELVYAEAKKIYGALSAKLGHSKYFYGEDPSSLDAVVYGFLATQFVPQLPNRELHFLITEHPNLVAFLNNISTHYFGATSNLYVDVEPARKWLQEQKDSIQRPLNKATSDKNEISTNWAIALGIGATTLFLLNNNIQVMLLAQHCWAKMNGHKPKSSFKPQWFPKLSDHDDVSSYDNPHSNAQFIGDDGGVYDWDEGYLESMETGSDIPDDHEDLDDDEDE